MIPAGAEPGYCKKMLMDLYNLSEYEAGLAVDEVMMRTGCKGTPLIVAVCNAVGIEPVEVGKE